MPAPVPSSSSAQLLRKPNNFYGGRLIVLAAGNTSGFDPFVGLSSFVAINFPAMPDTIELARSVEYMVVNSQVMPDGIHQYKATQSLNIPFSFKLHSFDLEYCPQGALSLLQVAALLQSFTLPISVNGKAVYVKSFEANQGEPPSNQVDSKVSRAQSADVAYRTEVGADADFRPPVTLRLELIFVDGNSPGIVCTGYVKDVRTKLNGPWLRGPGSSANLPTSADYEFTFVHVPGYGNDFNIAQNTTVPDSTTAQAYADDVRQKLYNTYALALKSGSANYRGFSS